MLALHAGDRRAVDRNFTLRVNVDELPVHLLILLQLERQTERFVVRALDRAGEQRPAPLLSRTVLFFV